MHSLQLTGEPPPQKWWLGRRFFFSFWGVLLLFPLTGNPCQVSLNNKNWHGKCWNHIENIVVFPIKFDMFQITSQFQFPQASSRDSLIFSGAEESENTPLLNRSRGRFPWCPKNQGLRKCVEMCLEVTSCFGVSFQKKTLAKSLIHIDPMPVLF